MKSPQDIKATGEKSDMALQTILNSFATEVFRRQADFDYIAARMNYKMRLRQQFLWSGQQAVEKYLKAILLYNGVSARFVDPAQKKKSQEFGHDLQKLEKAVRKLSHLKIDLPDWAPSFMKYLTEFGGLNRYLTTGSYNTSDVLPRLDELVWNIRRYCQYFTDRGLGCKSEIPGMKDAILRSINNPSHKNEPTNFKLTFGDLEKVLKRDKDDPARKALVWANLYFGTKNRTKIKFRSMSSSEIPPQERAWFEKETNRKIISDYIRL